MPRRGLLGKGVGLPSLSIVIPCHNECEAIPAVLASIDRTRARLLEIGAIDHCQVVVVNDASSDDTADLLARCGWVDILHLEKQVGYGAALKAGFRASRGDWIAFLDLDGTYDPEDIETLLKEYKEDVLVLGERLSSGLGMPWTRTMGNAMFTWLVGALYRQSVKDVCSGCRIFSRRWLPEILEIPNNGLDYALAITLWALRKRIPIREIPIRYHKRTGESKLSLMADGNRFLWTILRSRYVYARASRPADPFKSSI
jgi:glycosyltransferase involved in cell wall biosynthesis